MSQLKWSMLYKTAYFDLYHIANRLSYNKPSYLSKYYKYGYYVQYSDLENIAKRTNKINKERKKEWAQILLEADKIANK